VKIKIMIVDDEPEFAEMVQMRLEANDYEVVVAADGQECLEKVVIENPALILLDVMMPGLDGFDVLKALQRGERTRFIPVVMLTARGESKAIFRAQEMGASDYLIKPFESDELLSVIRKHV
jgi:DNA-binding response OmpR family regulator